ncbi:MAG: radical SAM protein [Candidatus Lokiarchaeota archaeon]|nr:radical SAM protein [Candidatus Lokiarchaeota archaeon]
MKDQKYPTSITLEVTQNCNLRCQMCYFWGETGLYTTQHNDLNPKDIDLELIKSITDEFSSKKALYSLFGGEPFLHPQIGEIIRLIKDSGGIVDTPTNGTLLMKYAPMLVESQFDTLRISLDGPEEINDIQRGRGSYKRALKGIEKVHELKKARGVRKPIVSLIFTITPLNYAHMKQFFLDDLNLDHIDWITIQMQNYVTEQMANEYAEFLQANFSIKSTHYCTSLIRDPKEFQTIDTSKIVEQVDKISARFTELGKNVLLEPPTYSERNLDAYLRADWEKMEDQYKSCAVPWRAIDITVDGDVAPCHIFYDLTMGNLHEQSFHEIWNSEQYRKLRAYMKKNNFMPICPGCCILFLMGKRI